MREQLTVSSSPHIRHIDSTREIMLDVIIALLPACIFGCSFFGIRAAVVLLVTVAAAVLSEFLWNLILKKPQSVGDLSAVVTGLLLGMNLPSTVPLWVAAIGSVAAIVVVKQMFGGIGCNFANPAIAARIILMVSFPKLMTNFLIPVDAVSQATPLASDVEYPIRQLFFGQHSGCIGETSAFLLLVGGLYLVVRRVISPVIPVVFVGTVALCSFLAGAQPHYEILKGGLMLGAIFMATDYTTTPITLKGKAIFALGCGLITFVIRTFGSLPEGVSYAILLMNILTPHIDRFTLAKPFGFIKPKKEEPKDA